MRFSRNPKTGILECYMDEGRYVGNIYTMGDAADLAAENEKMVASRSSDRPGIRNLTETVGEARELSYIRRIIGEHRWIFAKTYAAFCPHEYTLRKEWENDADYRALVNFIWRSGLDAWYGKKDYANRYWFDHEGGYYYFVSPEDTDEEGNATEAVILVNRAKISDFDFWKDKEKGIIRCSPKKRFWKTEE